MGSFSLFRDLTIWPRLALTSQSSCFTSSFILFYFFLAMHECVRGYVRVSEGADGGSSGGGVLRGCDPPPTCDLSLPKTGIYRHVPPYTVQLPFLTRQVDADYKDRPSTQSRSSSSPLRCSLREPGQVRKARADHPHSTKYRMSPASNTGMHTTKHDLEKAFKHPAVGDQAPPAAGTLIRSSPGLKTERR